MRRGYRIDLSVLPAVEGDASGPMRSPGPEDLEALAELMLEAYRGTIDYEGETIVEARDEVSGYLAHDPLLDHSRMVFDGSTAASAVLLTTWRDEPFVAYVMTRPERKRQGLARTVLLDALTSVRTGGWSCVHPFITDGNVASEVLFASLGAVEMSDEV
jgi:GNAT superfamily N-acetyltransferase